MTDNPISILSGKHIVLGVTASIACYKAITLASALTQAGALVDVILTDAAQKFVTPLTFGAVTGRAVYTDMWHTETGGGMPTHIAHIGLAESADLLAIIPATADTLARLAGGFANDLITITALAARCPLLIAPAMDGAMYAHPAMEANLQTLVTRGAILVSPEFGRFASGLSGLGRLPEPLTLMGAIRAALGKQSGVLAGKRMVITAGGTREPLDPVRYLGNRSSGKQGYALAAAAVDVGASVTLISTTDLPLPYGATLVRVETAAAMAEAVRTHAIETPTDALIMAAAVADFRPMQFTDQKIKKSDANVEGFMLELARTEDILGMVNTLRNLIDHTNQSPRVVVGFAAESEQLLDHAREKMIRKGVDLLVANDITGEGAGFAGDTNRVILLAPDTPDEALPLMSKIEVSERVMARVAALLHTHD